MKRDMDKWLQEKIDEDLITMADEWEKMLMESEEFQEIKMPEEALEEIHRKIEAEKHASRKISIHRRAIIVVAAVLVLCVGMGVVSSGNKVYIPEILQRMRGDEVETKVDNTESVYREFDEETVCQEVEEKLGVLPVRFLYQPSGICLTEYWIKEDANETVLTYKTEEGELHVYISKDYRDSRISNQPDGEKIDVLMIISCGLEVEVYKYKDSHDQTYFETSFEYLNTYYSISGMMSQEEFVIILENIVIKNA